MKQYVKISTIIQGDDERLIPYGRLHKGTTYDEDNPLFFSTLFFLLWCKIALPLSSCILESTAGYLGEKGLYV